MVQRIFDTPEGKVLGTLIVTEEDIQKKRDELLKSGLFDKEPRKKLTTTERRLNLLAKDFITTMDAIEDVYYDLTDTKLKRVVFSFCTMSFTLLMGTLVGNPTLVFTPPNVRLYIFLGFVSFFHTYLTSGLERKNRKRKWDTH